MSLPELANSAKNVTKSKVSKLGNTISQSASPKRLISKGFDTVSASLSAEAPELSAFTASVKSTISDFRSNLNSEISKSNEKLTKIEKESEDQNESLTVVAKVLDGGLRRIQDQNDEELAEIRTLTEITRQNSKVSEEQVSLLRDANKLSALQEKETKFKQQKDTSKIKAPEAVKKASDKVSAVKNGNGLNLLYVGLLGALSGIGETLKKILTSVASFVGVSKLLPKTLRSVDDNQKKLTNYQKLRQKAEEKRAKNEEFLKRQNKRDEKTGQFRKVNQTDRNLLNQEQGKKRKKRAKRLNAVKGAGLGLIGGIGFLGAFATLAVGAFGFLSEGLKAYIAGDDFKQIISKAVKGMVVRPLQMISDLVTGMLGVEQLNIGEMYEKVTDAIGHMVKFIIHDIPNFFYNISDRVVSAFTSTGDKIGKFLTNAQETISSVFSDMFDAVINGMKSMSNSIIDSIPLLPQSAKDSLKFDVKSNKKEKEQTEKEKPQPPLEPKKKQQQRANDMMRGQETIMNSAIDRTLNPQYGFNQQQPSMINAPFTQNTSNTTVISPNIITRNPDSPIIQNNKVTY